MIQFEKQDQSTGDKWLETVLEKGSSAFLPSWSPEGPNSTGTVCELPATGD